MKTLLAMAICLPILASAQGQQGRFGAADRALNETYRAIMKKLPPRTTAALRESQRAWIEFRDANAAFAASMPNGGSQATVNQKALDTERRVAFLTTHFASGAQIGGDPDKIALSNVDQQLNEEYRVALAGLPGAGGEVLRSTQRAWVVVRDADLNALVAVGAVRNDNGSWAILRAIGEMRVRPSAVWLCSARASVAVVVMMVFPATAALIRATIALAETNFFPAKWPQRLAST